MMRIPDIQIGINTTMHKTTQKSSSELLFGFRVTGTTEFILTDVVNDTINVTPSDEISEMRQKPGESIRQQKDCVRFNKRRKSGNCYKEGDLVYVEREICSNDGKSKKLLPKYQRPY